MPTYGAVRTKFKARLRRRDCDDTLADGFLTDAIRRTNRILRVPAMETSSTVTVGAITYPGHFPLPADYVMTREFTRTGVDGLPVTMVRQPLAVVQRLAALDVGGYPVIYARQGTGLITAPYPLTAEVLRLDYYATFSTTMADADTNSLTSLAEDLMVYGALSYACDHFNDKRGAKFEERYVQIISDLQMEADEDETSGSSAVQQGYTYPADNWE